MPVPSSLSEWVLLAAAFFTLLTAIGAFLSAWSTSKTSHATIVMRLDGEYGSSAMKEAMAKLYAFRDKYGHNVWLERYVERWKDSAKDDSGEVAAIDPGRRMVEHWYYQLDHLLIVGCINNRFVRNFMTPTQIQFLEQFIFPIYRKLPNPGHAFERIFKALKKTPPSI